MGAVHNRCDEWFIRSRISTLSRSNTLLDRLIILSPCEHDRLNSLPEPNEVRSSFESRLGRGLLGRRPMYHSCVYGPALQESSRARDGGDGRIRRLHFLARGYVALLAGLARYLSLFRLDHRLHRLSRPIRQAASRASHECRTTA